MISIEDIEEDAREVLEDLASAKASTSQNDALPPPPPSETSTPGPSQHGAQQQQSNRKMSSARKKRGKRKGHNRTGSKSSVKDIFAGGSTGQNIFAMDEDEETNQVGSLPLFYFFQCLKCLELFSSLFFHLGKGTYEIMKTAHAQLVKERSKRVYVIARYRKI